MAGGGIKINNIKLNGGADGATFIPSVSSDGVLSWTNDKGYTNPTPVKIKGADGKNGVDGATGAKLVSQVLQGQDANGGNIYLQTFDDGTTATFTAPKGDKGDKGDMPSIAQTTGQSTTEVMSQKAVTDELNKKANKTDIDKYFAALLNDTNTTETFKAWYNATNDGEVTRYALLERFFRMLALNNDQTHTVRFYSSAVSSDSKGTPLDWLADKKAQVLATDAGVVENANSWLDADGVTRNDGEDWATENRITWYVRANALSLDDGTMDVLAIEGVDDTFDITGNLAPVYSFQLSPWYKETDDGEYLIKSWRANYAEGYAPFNNNVDFDGNPRALTWHASFGGVMTNDGTKLTSGAHRRPKNYTSASMGLTYARNWNAYEAVGADANAKWLLNEWQHRHFNKENSKIAEGCLNYNYQYRVALTEENALRVLLTTAQAANFVVGSSVLVGDNSSTSAPDRDEAAVYNLSGHSVKITKIETVEIEGASYAALTLDLDSAITTTATTWVSTSPWDTGSTEGIYGTHLDGSIGNLTNGKYPLRFAGCEVLIGAYFIGLDVLYNVTVSDENGKFNYQVYECKDSEKIASSITANYVDTNISYEKLPQGWNYVKEFVSTDKPVLFPSTFGGSTSGWYKSAFDGAYSAGVRCPWRFGSLSNGGRGGLACEGGYSAPSISHWYGMPWLTGSEKKRGEWLGGNA